LQPRKVVVPVMSCLMLKVPSEIETECERRVRRQKSSGIIAPNLEWSTAGIEKL
jgi:hypothetical protein